MRCCDGGGLALRGVTQFGNVSVLRTNAMKFLPNYFAKGQVRVRLRFMIDIAALSDSVADGG